MLSIFPPVVWKLKMPMQRNSVAMSKSRQLKPTALADHITHPPSYTKSHQLKPTALVNMALFVLEIFLC